MKFRNFENLRLMNEADEGGEGGGIDISFGDESGDDYANQDLSDNDEQAFKDHGLDFNKYGFDKEESEPLKADSQGSETKEVEGQATDESSILERINALGAIHNNSPVKVESLDELKNLVQMGKDYTLKTQSLSEERKAWDQEKSSAETELNAAIEHFNKELQTYQGQLQELQEWQFTLNELKQAAPDLFEEVQRAHSGTVKQFRNPILDQQLAAIKAELAETKKGLAQREDKLIVDSFESEYSKIAGLEQSAKELGITVNKDEVKKKWAGTGMSAEDAFVLQYGKLMMQAQASKSKVDATKAKVTAKPVASGNKSRPGNQVKAIDPKLKGLSYASALLDRYQNKH